MTFTYNTDLFYFDEEKSWIVIESSDLNLPPRYWNSLVNSPPEKEITITGFSGKSIKFEFDKCIEYTEKEIGGWIYKDTSGGTLQLHIIND